MNLMDCVLGRVRDLKIAFLSQVIFKYWNTIFVSYNIISIFLEILIIYVTRIQRIYILHYYCKWNRAKLIKNILTFFPGGLEVANSQEEKGMFQTPLPPFSQGLDPLCSPQYCSFSCSLSPSPITLCEKTQEEKVISALNHHLLSKNTWKWHVTQNEDHMY